MWTVRRRTEEDIILTEGGCRQEKPAVNTEVKLVENSGMRSRSKRNPGFVGAGWEWESDREEDVRGWGENVQDQGVDGGWLFGGGNREGATGDSDGGQ